MLRTSAAFRYALYWMVAILLFASLLYLANINRVSFWEDESWMAMAVKGDLPSVWTFATQRGVHPPFYFYLGWFYTRLAGDSEIALRWLAGLCGLIGIAWTYRLAALWYGRRAGVFAALLAAGSLFLIYFGRLARQYTLLFALAPALVCIYWQAVGQVASKRGKSEKENPASLRTSSLVLITLLQAALLYTHYFGVWMALVIGLHALLTLPRRDALKVIGALAVAGVAFVPWVPSVIQQLNGSSSGLGYVNRDILINLRAYVDRVFNGNYALGLVLTVLGVWAVYRWRAFKGGLLLAIWLTIPLILSLLMNTRFAWFIDRNMIFTLAGVYVLLGAGLAWISRQRMGRVAALLAALVFIVLGVASYDTFWPFITPDWRDIAHAIAGESRADDPIVLDGEPYSIAYYLERETQHPFSINPLKAWLTPASLPTTPDRLWVVDANWKVPDEVHQALPRDMVLTRQYVLGVLVAEFYQRAPQNALTTFGGQVTLGFLPEDALLARPGRPLTVDLWWRAANQPQADYSVGVYLVDINGQVVAQQDGGFDQGRVSALALPLDHWIPDARVISIPDSLAPGAYTLTAAVYDWQSGIRLIPEKGLDNASYPLANVSVESPP